jgi:hypothetical protein
MYQFVYTHVIEKNMDLYLCLVMLKIVDWMIRKFKMITGVYYLSKCILMCSSVLGISTCKCEKDYIKNLERMR